MQEGFAWGAHSCAAGPHGLGGCSGAQGACPGNRRGFQPVKPVQPSSPAGCTRQVAAQHRVPGGELVAPATVSAAGTPMWSGHRVLASFNHQEMLTKSPQLCEFIIFKQLRFLYLQIHFATPNPPCLSSSHGARCTATSAARKNYPAPLAAFYFGKKRGRKNITVIMYLLLKHLGRESA